MQGKIIGIIRIFFIKFIGSDKHRYQISNTPLLAQFTRTISCKSRYSFRQIVVIRFTLRKSPCGSYSFTRFGIIRHRNTSCSQQLQFDTQSIYRHIFTDKTIGQTSKIPSGLYIVIVQKTGIPTSDTPYIVDRSHLQSLFNFVRCIYQRHTVFHIFLCNFISDLSQRFSRGKTHTDRNTDVFQNFFSQIHTGLFKIYLFKFRKIKKSFINGIYFDIRCKIFKNSHHSLRHITVKRKIGRKSQNFLFGNQIFNLKRRRTHFDTQSFSFITSGYDDTIIVRQNYDSLIT